MIHFFKYQGAGNDFVILDAIAHPKYKTIPADFIQLLCDRHFGIGADGLMMIDNCDHADFEMNYYNSDGKLGTMCGNGGRCIVAFAYHMNYVKENCTFMAVDGLHQAEVLENGLVRISLHVQSDPVPYEQDFVIDTGSPHYIAFIHDIDQLDMVSFGRSIRYSEQFLDKGINVNAVEIIQDGQLKIRTYERGVEGETLACGTGVTAAACVYIHKNKHLDLNQVEVWAKGGVLKVIFDSDTHLKTKIYLEGPAQLVFEGSILV